MIQAVTDDSAFGKNVSTIKAVGTIYRGLMLKSASLKRMGEPLVGAIYEEAAAEVAAMAVALGWMTIDELSDSVDG